MSQAREMFFIVLELGIMCGFVAYWVQTRVYASVVVAASLWVTWDVIRLHNRYSWSGTRTFMLCIEIAFLIYGIFMCVWSYKLDAPVREAKRLKRAAFKAMTMLLEEDRKLIILDIHGSHIGREHIERRQKEIKEDLDQILDQLVECEKTIKQHK